MATTPAAPVLVTKAFAHRSAEPRAGRALMLYYLFGTPLFFLGDVVLGVSIRAAFLDNRPMPRFMYYALAFACGLAAARWPRWSGVVGVVESGANIALLVFGVMLSYLAALDAVAGDAPIVSPFGVTSVMNLVLSAIVLTVAYTRHQAPLLRLKRSTWPPPETTSDA
jgi:hypothetical protein